MSVVTANADQIKNRQTYLLIGSSMAVAGIIGIDVPFKIWHCIQDGWNKDFCRIEYSGTADAKESKGKKRTKTARSRRCQSAKRGLGAGAANERKQISGVTVESLFCVFVGTNTQLAK